MERWIGVVSLLLTAWSLTIAPAAQAQVARRLPVPPHITSFSPRPQAALRLASSQRAEIDAPAVPQLAPLPPPYPGAPLNPLPAPAGVAEPVPEYLPEFLPPGPGYEEYLIQPGDELEVKFRYTPELNELVTVRPDGLISLQIVGEVLAENQTSEMLRYELRRAYGTVLKDPQIIVLVRKFAANDVFVGGEVKRPGRVPISGQLSVLQAIILAGGFADTADRKRVILRREGCYGQELNLKDEIQAGRMDQDLLLRPYDVVYVPKSPIAKVNLFVEQYIEKVLPFQRQVGVFVTRELNTP